MAGDGNPDFFTQQTLRDYNAVFEVKNKASLSSDDIVQIRDFSQWSGLCGGEVTGFARPGLDLSPLAEIQGVRPMVVPQQPMVISVPTLDMKFDKNGK